MVGSGNQAERKIDIMDNFLDLGRSLVPDNLFQVMIALMMMMMTLIIIMIMDNFLDLGGSLVPDNLFKVLMVIRSKVFEFFCRIFPK